MSAFTWVILRPSIGIDDANITQNYAQNIASGLGYVYYEGGPPVEGSTSALWTALNVLGFLITETPEMLFAVMGFAFAIGMVFFTILIANSLLRMADIKAWYSPLLVSGLYTLIPTLFGWTVWSLMETGLWCFLLAGYLWAATRILEERQLTGTHPWHLSGVLGLFAVLIVLTRPEGIALVMGSCIVLAALGQTLIKVHFIRAPLLAIAVSLLAFTGLMMARLWYFGVPHPNTYYAKVSTDRMSEIIDGLRYTKDYLKQPEHILLFFLAVLALVLLIRLPRPKAWVLPRLLPVIIFFVITLLGGLGVYIGLGGDNFIAHRYYLIFLPILIPSAALAMIMLIEGGHVRGAAGTALCIGLVAFAQWVEFTQHTGSQFARIFRLAEDARDVGTRLNEIPGHPTVAVYIAGGIAMTYDGPILDMNGLNWADMAHADRDVRDKYGGFSKTVFYQAQPDIVSPHINGCAGAEWFDNDFVDDMLHGLFNELQFLEHYVLQCWNGVSFFRLKTLEIGPVSRRSPNPAQNLHSANHL